MNLKPVGDRVIVEIVEDDEVTTSGIYLAPTARDNSPVYRASVLAVGAGRITDRGNRIPMPLNVGDEIYISRYGGLDIEIEGKDYIIVRETDILAVVV